MAPLFLVLLLLSLTAVPSAAHRGKRQATSNDTESDGPDVTDVITKANADIKKGLEHGDILQSKDKYAMSCLATGCKWRKKKDYVYVPYYISHKYSTAQRKIITDELLHFNTTTCIRFVPWKRGNMHFLYFYSGSGCWSYLGRQIHGQAISLRKNDCLYRGTVQHEILHALGFHHEHVRSDRDANVQINTENIQPGKEGNFKKVKETNNLGTPYDFYSVMHYSKYAFSKNGRPTITARSNPDLDFGHASQMSENDIDRVNKLYKCSV